ncbi:hypothetical protein [Flavobacterium sp. Root186]|uniref:hypothetical protein n=1 Tax=Flavobacterium sp. Root186 TaxID=1736485 RepID=UPI0006FEF7DB|nr:hypothetical protein [Flavobacterium sp. Root186]KRB54697.1 hypothetical protein ASD98_16790 [Flavobacterium sp. Root186]
MDKYRLESTNLLKAADIAVRVIKQYPPANWDTKTLNHVVNCYIEWKNDAENPQPQFANLTSLKFVMQRVLTMFHEGHGIFVEEFWKEIKNQNLPYKRENKMVKILKRKKINNIREYDFVVDVIVPYEQEGLINQDEVILLNTLLAEFETRKKK